MNKLICIWLAILVISGCQSFEELNRIDSNQREQDFTKYEAKEYFEKEYSRQITKHRGEVSYNTLSPGDFTPLWDTGICECSNTIVSYDVRFLNNRKITAIRVAEFGNVSYAHKINVYQKITVVKSLKDGSLGCYILSLIPDSGSDSSSNILSHFVNMRDKKGHFTGIAVYTTLVDGAIIKLDRYVSGHKVDGVYFFDKRSSMEFKCRKCLRLLNGISFRNTKIIKTKVGEDEWSDEISDIEYDNPYSEYEDVGFGVFTDGQGNWAVDIDGDGIPDIPCIAPSYDIEDPTEETNPDPDDTTTKNDENWPSYDNDYDDYPQHDIPLEDEEGNTPDIVEDINSWKESPFENINLMLTDYFVKYSESKDCLKGCKKMMDNFGFVDEYGSSNRVIYLAREDNDHLVLKNYGNDIDQNYKNAVECINDHLGEERPIIVGTDYELGKGYNDGTIDHFVLIVGSGYDEETEQNYYIYVDPGTNIIDKGVNQEENRFYYDDDKGMFIDASDRNSNELTITEIRPNNNEEYETIIQPSRRIYFTFYLI